MRAAQRPFPELAAAVPAFGLAFVVATELARPFRGGAVAFDSAVAVVYFERLAAGRQLEQFVTTTPKPLLTIVYGLLYGLTDDWRALSWSAILAFALGVALLAVVALRVGGLVPAVFAAVALAGTPQLLLDTGLALAWPWALLGLSIAGIALTGSRPRYAMAGIALLVATLARLELLVVVLGVAAALVLVRFGPSPVRRPLPAASWLLLLALLAPPVMMLHDWLLTGNPLHWTLIAERYSRAASDEVRGLLEIADAALQRYLDIAPLTLLALLGVAWLLRSRRAPLAVGLLLLGPGVLAFLLFLAARATFVDDRYFVGPDLAVVLAAAFGIGALRLDPGWSRTLAARWPGGLRAALLVAVTALVAVATSGGWAFDADVRALVRSQLALAIDTRAVLPEMRAFVDEHAELRAFPDGDGRATPLLLVPVRMRPHLVADLELPLGEVASTDPGSIDLAGGYPEPGQLVYHHVHGDRHPAPLETLRTAEPVEREGVLIVPVAVDAGRGYWLLRIDEP